MLPNLCERRDATYKPSHKIRQDAATRTVTSLPSSLQIHLHLRPFSVSVKASQLVNSFVTTEEYREDSEAGVSKAPPPPPPPPFDEAPPASPSASSCEANALAVCVSTRFCARGKQEVSSTTLACMSRVTHIPCESSRSRARLWRASKGLGPHLRLPRLSRGRPSAEGGLQALSCEG